MMDGIKKALRELQENNCFIITSSEFRRDRYDVSDWKDFEVKLGVINDDDTVSYFSDSILLI